MLSVYDEVHGGRMLTAFQRSASYDQVISEEDHHDLFTGNSCHLALHCDRVNKHKHLLIHFKQTVMGDDLLDSRI